ncbi:hypothetical protein LCGC14_1983940, partial [marine sediment metagenome]
IKAGLISIDGGCYVVSSFADRQGPSQEEKRKQWRDRQRRHREKQMNVTGDSRVTHESDVTESHGVDKRREDKNREESSISKSVDFADA